MTRDVDLLAELAKFQAAVVFISVTTLDASLTAKLESRTSSPNRRLAAIETLAKAGVPVGALVAPVIPGLTDHELPAILQAVANAGATFAGYTPLRLPGAVAPLFEQWLIHHFPDRKDKILNRIRSIRGDSTIRASIHACEARVNSPMESRICLHSVVARRGSLGKYRARRQGISACRWERAGRWDFLID